MAAMNKEELARIVDDAAHKGHEIEMLSAQGPLDLETAYDVQRLSMKRRFERGEKLVGMKMGLTSLAKMQQMGVHNPIYGHLTSSMQLGDGATVKLSEHLHPRVEPEIAFILGEDIRGPVTPAQAMLAVHGLCAALEVIDSRYKDFKFTLPDVVADNASSTKFIIGSDIRHPAEIDISNLGMVMSLGSRAQQIGSSAAIYEHPARSLAALANMLHERDEYLRAGMIVLAGGATAAVHLEAGDEVMLEVAGLGTTSFSVVE